MSEYLSNRKRNLNIGIRSYTENNLVLDVIGNANISGISSLGITFANSLEVSGTSTLGITSTTNLTAENLQVSGITTLGITSISNLTSENLQVSGISTLGITSTTNLTAENLQVSGISTISTLNVGTGGTIVTTTDTGLVGIGTTNPTKQLSVSGDIGIGGSIFDSTGVSGSNQYVLTSTPTGVLWQSVTGVGAILGLNISETTEDVVNYIPFVNVSYGTTAVAYVSDTQLTYNPSTNNLGIGTTNATSKLTVYGDGRFSGVVTATRFVGDLDGAISIANTAINLQGGDASQLAYQSAPGITSFIPNGTSGYLLKSNGTDAPSWIGVQELTIDYATSSGIATYAINAGVATDVIGGIGSITQLQVTGISTFTNGPVLIGSGTSTGTASQPLQVTGGVYVSQNLGIGTTTPSSKLTVEGNTLVSGVTTSSEFVGGGSNLRNLSGTHLVSYASASDISNSALSISGISTYNQVGILTGTYAVDTNDNFGRSLATSADGKTIIVGAHADELSGTTGYGLVYVYDRVGNSYNQVGILTGTYAVESGDAFGRSLATSADGKTIVVGAISDEIGTPNDTGVVYVYDRVGNSFNQVGILTGSYAVDTGDAFGRSIATSADGKTIVVSASSDEISDTTGYGLVYVYDRVGNSFNQVGILTGTYASQASDNFGISVATSADGKTIVVGTYNDEIGTPNDTGVVYVYDRVGNSFNQVGILTGSYAVATNDNFGISVATSSDGKTIVVGAQYDEIGTPNDTGLVYVFDRVGNSFNQVGILTGSLASQSSDTFGISVATSSDGKTIVVGAQYDEISVATSTGIAYIFKRQGNSFNQVGILTGSYAVDTNDYFGISVATSADGKTIVVGAIFDEIGSITNTGVVYVFDENRDTYIYSGPTGNIGIGTTNPTSKLHVVGGGRFTGVVTATTFVGNLTGISSTAINLQGGDASQIPYQVSPGITSFIPNGTSGWLLQANGTDVPSWVNPAFGFNVSNADYALVAGVSTDVIGGIGSLTQLQVTGISTFTNGPVFIGTETSTGTESQPLQVTGGAYVSDNLGIGATNPQDKLDVSSSTDTVNIRLTSAGGNYGPDTNYSIIQSVSNSAQSTINFKVVSGSGNSFTALSANYEGVVETGFNEASQLNVKGGTRNYNFNNTGSILNVISLSPAAQDCGGSISLNGFYNTDDPQNDSKAFAVIKGYKELSDNSSNGYLSFLVNDGGSAATEKVRITSSGNLGIGTIDPTSKLTVEGDGKFTGVVTATTFIGNLDGYASSSGISTYADNSGIATAATKLQDIRTFEITGVIVAAPQDFDGTANVSFASSIQPNTVGLGTHTYGDYVKNITGTVGEIEVDFTSGVGVSPQIGLPDDVTISNLTVTNDVQINRNLNVTGNITIGGTSAYLAVENLVIRDRDIVTGFVTDVYGNDVSTDITANTGGLSVASTEGTPLVNLNVVGFETLPPTYKKIMWFKANTFAGLNTDAWMFNYGIGIGSTQIPNGVRLAVGGVQVTDSDIVAVRNINASGIITALSFVGNITGVASDAINLQGGDSSQIPYQTAPGITSFIPIGTSGWLLQANGTSAPSWVNPAFGFNVSNADYAINAGVATDVIGGFGSITSLNVSGISTLGTVVISSGIVTSTTGIVTYYGDGYNLSRTKQSYTKNNTIVGSGTTLNFIGAGVSSVTLSNDIVTVNIPSTIRTVNTYTATLNQTTFSATYNLGFIDVYLNGSKLSEDQYTATDGLTIVLETGASLGDIVDIIGYMTYKVVGTQTILSDTISSTSGITTSYTGLADQGSSQSSNIWTIRRSVFTSAGILSSTASASNVAWINRLSVTYT